jgi:peptide/nickel transport system substrate-binding protein
MIAGLAFILVIALAGCRASESASPGAASPGASAGASDSLVVAIAALPSSIDLDVAAGTTTWLVAGQVLARGLEYGRVPYPFAPVDFADPTKVPGFTYPDYDLTRLTPGVLDSCELSADGKTALYKIRKGVISAAGNEFTSADVLWRIKRSVALQGNTFFNMVVAGAPDLNQWSAVDRYTVRITSSEPMPLICAINVHIYTTYLDSVEAQKHATPDDPWAKDWLAKHGTSFGPYEVVEWDPGNRIVMEANEHYFRGAPSIKKVILQVVPDAAGRLSLLRAGQVDIAEALSTEQIVSLKDVPGVRILGQRSPTGLWAIMNNSQAPYDNVLVRRAVNMAMPRSDIASKIYLGLANEWQGTCATVFPAAGCTDRHDYDLNIAGAKELLSQAGLAEGFSTTLSYSAGEPSHEQVAILIKDSLSHIGVTVTLQKLPPATLQDLVTSRTGKFAFALWSDAAFLPDPAFVSQVTYSIGNFSLYDSSRVDPLIKEGVSILEPKARREHFQRVQQLEYEDAPLGWIVEPWYLAAMSDRVEGYNTDAFPFYNIAPMSLK